MENRDFKGVWIPKDIWELNIPINDKFYLSLYKENNDIVLTDTIMSNIVSKSSLLKIKNRLAYVGYIEFIKTPEQAKKFVIEVANKGKTCEWCHNKCYVLHKHHYPISKKHKGSKTVNICPNCHTVYHKIFKED